MKPPSLRVLFLCTGNSARSQIGEAILRHLSSGKIEVFSAGSHPRPEIHPLARIAASKVLGLDMVGQHPKSMDEFRNQRFDHVITVCDRAAESCPIFPGDPERVVWSLEDPAEVEGSDEEKSRAFERTARDLMAQIRIWMALPAISRRIDAHAK
jgi:ArsR family transcriptional regulator, arsenate/arsenite/antimonite-responsive transcriptional repressor / arsenate reductase (thioredoxin)